MRCGCCAEIRLRLFLVAIGLSVGLSALLPAIGLADDPPPAGHLAGAGGGSGVDTVIFLDRDPVQLTTITGEVFSFSYSADDKILAACGGGRWDNQSPGYVRVWDLSSGQEIASYQSPRGVGSIALSSDGRRIAWSSWNRETVLRDIDGPELVRQTSNRSTRVAFSPDDSLLAVGHEDSGMTVLDGRTGQLLAPFSGDAVECHWITFSNDGTLILGSGGPAGNNKDKPQIGIWNATSHQQVFKATGHPYQAFSCSLSPDNKIVAACCNSSEIWLWNVDDGAVLRKLESTHPTALRTVFSPDGKLMASSGSDGPIHLWNTSTWEKVGTLTGHSGDVRGLKFSHDGRTLASGGVDQAIHLWDVEAKKEKSQLQPAGGTGESRMQVLAVAYAPDGNRVATASEDGRISTYDVRSGKLVQSWQGHSDAAVCLAYSPDGQTLASGGYDKAVQLWNPAAGHPLR